MKCIKKLRCERGTFQLTKIKIILKIHSVGESWLNFRLSRGESVRSFLNLNKNLNRNSYITEK